MSVKIVTYSNKDKKNAVFDKLVTVSLRNPPIYFFLFQGGVSKEAFPPKFCVLYLPSNLRTSYILLS
jgi:hypothetical protein